MKLSDKAKKALTTKCRNRIAIAMDCSIYSVDRWVRENEDNGNLTKSVPVQIISEETEIPVEEILEESEIKEGQGI